MNLLFEIIVVDDEPVALYDSRPTLKVQNTSNNNLTLIEIFDILKF